MRFVEAEFPLERRASFRASEFLMFPANRSLFRVRSDSLMGQDPRNAFRKVDDKFARRSPNAPRVRNNRDHDFLFGENDKAGLHTDK